ncbi:TerD family protein [Exiguobacterium artemiae]|uniref:TerD family protein n=1 Tax=Exiguobacterium artemiae TaxID=340145 RepID=UPI00047BFBD1|nr:TerD family protein [Exiguobacterium sibiricum]
MSVNLVKGQKIDLTKNSKNLSNLMVGLGWDPVQKETSGFLGSLFGGSSNSIDCDASVLMLDQNGKLLSQSHVIYFGNLSSLCGSIKHSGDNLTGEGDGDDEQILVSLDRVPSSVQKLLFVVNIYDCENRKQEFGMIKNAYIRIQDVSTGSELLKFNLTDNFQGLTSLVTGEIYRHNNEWKFNAIGDGTKDKSLSSILSKYI